MRQYVAKAPDDMIGDRTGQEAQMQVTLRDVEPFNLWVSLSFGDATSMKRASGVGCHFFLEQASISVHLGMQLWMEMYEAPSAGEAELVEEVFKSWFMVGRLGGFNGMNLQVDPAVACCSPQLCCWHLLPARCEHAAEHAASLGCACAGCSLPGRQSCAYMWCIAYQVFNNAADEGASFLEYDAEECETGLDALFHDMSNTERNGSWLRTWCGIPQCTLLNRLFCRFW
jgi:Protein of unknown function (DUF3531)